MEVGLGMDLRDLDPAPLSVVETLGSPGKSVGDVSEVGLGCNTGHTAGDFGSHHICHL